MNLHICQNTRELREPSISCETVVRSFSSGKITNVVLKEITLKIYPGELTMIVGPSGSGKTTLLSVLSGLLKPDSGKVFSLGTDLWSLTPNQIESFRMINCGFVFQGFNLFSSLTAIEQVMLMQKYMGFSDKDAMDAAKSVITEVGLDDCLNLKPIELSGGQKQRVAIARALVKQPKLLFADEPTSALDKENGQIVISLLHKAAQVHGTTILAVTHDPRLLSHADRIVRLEDGKIIKDERISKLKIEAEENEAKII